MSHDSIDLWGLIAWLWGFTDSKMENIFRICLGFFKYDYGQKEEKEIRKAFFDPIGTYSYLHNYVIIII